MRAIEITGASKRYGGFAALTDVDLAVEEGGIHAVIGTNGAGKSTLLGVLCGTIRPDRGRVRIRGDDVTRMPAWRRARRGLGRSFQVSRLFEQVTVRANLEIAAAVALRSRGVLLPRRAAEKERVTSALEHTGLVEMQTELARNLSQGDQKRLEIAFALAMGATVLALDEPTAGMSTAETVGVTQLLDRVSRVDGVTILLVEHDMDVVFTLAGRITVLHHGRVAFEGTPAETAADSHVREIYLGDSAESSIGVSASP